jgi:hypothetical protein
MNFGVGLVLYLGAMTGGGLWSLLFNERRIRPTLWSRAFGELTLRWYLGAFYLLLLIFPGCLLSFIEMLPRAILSCFGHHITGPTYVGKFYDLINPLLDTDLDRLFPVNPKVLEKEKRKSLYTHICLAEHDENEGEKEKARSALVDHMMTETNNNNNYTFHTRNHQWVAVVDHPDDHTLPKIVLEQTAARTKLACQQKINNIHLTKQQHQSLLILPFHTCK